MKELPATLLLRPFNFETLATHVYEFATLEQVENGALGALTIVIVGLVPVLLLHSAIATGRAGGAQKSNAPEGRKADVSRRRAKLTSTLPQAGGLRGANLAFGRSLIYH